MNKIVHLDPSSQQQAPISETHSLGDVIVPRTKKVSTQTINQHHHHHNQIDKKTASLSSALLTNKQDIAD